MEPLCATMRFGAMDAVLLMNPRGGSAARHSPAELVETLAEAGVPARVEQVEGPDLAARAAALSDSGVPLLIAAGGDGTISAVAGALADTNTTLGILPLGTLNHFARDLGIPHDMERAAAVIAANVIERVDVAELNGRPFINNSAIGLYPLMVIDREAQQKRLGRSKRLAMLVASVRTLVRFKHERLRLHINHRGETRLDTPLLFVGNNDYELAFPAAGCRQSLTDGRLCVMVMRSKGRWGFLSAAVRSLFGLTRSDDMIRLDDVQSLEVSARRSKLIVSADGETLCLDAPLDFRIRPGALKVLVPALSGYDKR